MLLSFGIKLLSSHKGEVLFLVSWKACVIQTVFRTPYLLVNLYPRTRFELGRSV